MNCPNCNSLLSEGAKFCKNCGTPVASITANPVEAAEQVENTVAAATETATPTPEATTEEPIAATEEPAIVPEDEVTSKLTPEMAPSTAFEVQQPEETLPLTEEEATEDSPLSKKQWFKKKAKGAVKGTYLASKIISIILAICFILVGVVTTAAGAVATVFVSQIDESEYNDAFENIKEFRENNKEEYKEILNDNADAIDELRDEIKDAAGIDIDLDISLNDLDDFYEEYGDAIESKEALQQTAIIFTAISAAALIVLSVLIFVACFQKSWILALIGFVLSTVPTFIYPLYLGTVASIPFLLLLIFNGIITIVYRLYKNSFNK